ncbi:MAG: terminase large subunit domain-containing protein [Polynucleobacter sp.]
MKYADKASLQALGLFHDPTAIKAIKARNSNFFDVKLCEQRMIADLLPVQREFVCNFTSRYVLYVGGLGAGKSFSSVVKAILLAFRSQGAQHIYLEPTFPMINQVALPTWFKILDKYNIPYSFRRAPTPEITLKLPKGDTQILLLPLLNYERLVGINAASLVIDEADTVKQEIAEAALIKLQGRVRVGGCPQICFASTPEGRKFIWNFFEKNKSDDKALYRADTRENPYLQEGYVEDLLEKYPPHLVAAYVRGEFVNLETATVFGEYDRMSHKSSVFQAHPGEVVLIGVDFNVGKCSSVYAVMRNSPMGQVLNVFDEHISRDTFALAEHVKRRFAAHLARNMVIIYPDSSGSHASTSSTMSDHDILRESGAKVIAERRNPPISETVAHVNTCFHKNQILINDATCSNLVEVCENWGYDATLKPAKGGKIDYSHFGDALRYLVWQSMPRPAIGMGRGQRWR